MREDQGDKLRASSHSSRSSRKKRRNADNRNFLALKLMPMIDYDWELSLDFVQESNSRNDNWN